MGRLIVVLFLPVALLVGCSSQTPVERWVAAQGGTISDGRLERARTLAVELCSSRPVPRIAVLDRADLAAFSWPGGEIYLSRGLIDALDDAALSAAIAHEMAHVLKHERSDQVTALRGSEAHLNEEIAADRLGAGLLEDAGIPRSAMAAMLEIVVRDGGLAPAVRSDLRRRIEILSHAD